MILVALFCVTFRIEPGDNGGWTSTTPPNNPVSLTVENGVRVNETLLVTVCNDGHTTIAKP
jgi:hypothetical protein